MMPVERAVHVTYLVTYQCITPVIIVLGILSNALCLVVLTRASLSALQVKRYFQMLVLCDLVLCIFYIPIAVTANGCCFQNYWFAVYFSHLGWAVPAFLHSFCTYILTWLALDRCLAVWWYQGCDCMKSQNFQLVRILVTAVFLFLIHVPYMVDAEVLCNTSNGTHILEVVDRDCENGTWTSNDGFQKSFCDTWHEVLRWFYAVAIRWGPAVMLAVFNLSLVLAVLRRRLKTVGRKGKRRLSMRAKKWERNLVYTMIGMTASYLCLSLPITVFLTFFGKYQGNRCYDWIPEEILRHCANLAQLLEHVLHPLFLAFLMPSFRRELLLMLHRMLRLPQPKFRTLSTRTTYSTVNVHAISST